MVENTQNNEGHIKKAQIHGSLERPNSPILEEIRAKFVVFDMTKRSFNSYFLRSITESYNY